MRKAEELALKLERVGRWLAEQNLAGILLSRTDNFAWIGCGADNSVVTSSESGVGTLLVRPSGLRLVANNIEAERLLAEELDGLDVSPTDPFPWHEPAQRNQVIRGLTEGGRFAADDGSAGLPPLPPGFARLRYSLTGAEVERYQALGRETTEAIECAARAVRKGMAEADVAALFASELERRSITPVVLLVAADDRITNWRHPIVKDAVVRRQVMLVTCGRRGGLIAAATRLVHFGELPEDLAKRHRAVCAVDAAMLLATMPGAKVADVFALAQQAYEREGYPGEWRKHHQGGAIGYQPREYLATGASRETVQTAQAFAWNPSITGTKCEDTMLASEEGAAMLTAPGKDWPVVTVEHECGAINRADILVM